MIQMKVNILYTTSDEPFGGGNQFLRALKKQFSKMGVYTEAEHADIFLFNSHHEIDKVKRIKERFPDRKFVHRIDGPMRLYNSMSDTRDFVVYDANNNLADATIFQSNWSKAANMSLGLKITGPNAVISNAVDSEIFYDEQPARESSKIHIVSASFSPNMRKGFKIYKCLDETLDFHRFEYIFAGNPPVSFRNIKNVGRLTSPELAHVMRNSHLYITASENDPCSNSLLEAMGCGLRVLALNSGGHPEIVASKENLFSSKEELLDKIAAYDSLPKCSRMRTIKEAAELYSKFFEEVVEYENR